MRRLLSVGIVAGLVAAFGVSGAGTAWAHEERTVGRYVLAVGFGTEPAYAGQQNSVQVLLHDAKTDRPVVDLGGTLRVEVRYGGTTMPPMTMEPDFEVGEFGTPGDYRAFFFPTRPGDFTFHLTGSIEGQRVDETFASGPKTFSSVTDPAEVEFPAKDPTNGELGDAVKRLVPRVQAQVRAVREMRDELASASDDADSARSLALIALIVGGVLGLAGVTLAVIGVRAARRGPTAG